MYISFNNKKFKSYINEMVAKCLVIILVTYLKRLTEILTVSVRFNII